jgi:hypothetical protein
VPRTIWDRLEDDHPPSPDRVGIALGWRILAIIAVCALVGAILWGISVAVSGPKGAGDVTRQNNSAQNRIYTQAHFQTLWGDIEAYKVQINQAARDKAEHPGDSFYATTYTGLFNTCVAAVTQYNADTDKTLFTDWKSANLPAHVDPGVCQPTEPTPSPSH